MNKIFKILKTVILCNWSLILAWSINEWLFIVIALPTIMLEYYLVTKTINKDYKL